MRNQQIFSEIDLKMNGANKEQITANDIDTYVHFSATKNLEQLH